ncbi:pyrroline-5-carboxylate reductase [Deinobacterium chartae]|uniref:Pyrroline-5-carboxylate reductase n=1 Tax=Deinobacterium chartae TaxID=521158 RepID=A0A841HZ06_9DEIO|nr:pyrroline-5-carboxylate reductase [Deinobacterium chartae]MBB6097450.1 pyrroline-5-carboxylate reductase [Deinobacterium chartae]
MKLAIVGVGKMGLALLEGVLRRGILQPHEVGIFEHNAVRQAALAEKHSVRPLSLAELGQAERVALCLQPRQFMTVAGELARPNVGYLSTMAGISTGLLARRLGTKRVVRAMPNLAATIGRASTAITAPREAMDNGDYDFGRAIFQAVGDVYDLPEHLFNTFTGMSGSGPAYAAVFAEALADGAVRMGLSRPLANELAAKALIATGELLLDKPHPGVLKDEVASPGGTTIAGIEALEAGAFRSAVIQAVIAATRRGAELGKDDE